MRPFHLAFPVDNLEKTTKKLKTNRSYVDGLGSKRIKKEIIFLK